MEAVVRELGFEPLCTGDAAHAREIIGQKQLVAAILDLHMPGESGDSLVRDIQARCPDTAILFVTADPCAEAKLREAGHADIPVLLKPFRFADLASRIRDLVEVTHGQGSGPG